MVADGLALVGVEVQASAVAADLAEAGIVVESVAVSIIVDAIVSRSWGIFTVASSWRVLGNNAFSVDQLIAIIAASAVKSGFAAVKFSAMVVRFALVFGGVQTGVGAALGTLAVGIVSSAFGNVVGAWISGSWWVVAISFLQGSSDELRAVSRDGE